MVEPIDSSRPCEVPDERPEPEFARRDRVLLGARLGDVVRAARRRADLSQRELADAAAVQPSTIARLECDGRTVDPRLSTLERVLSGAGLRLAVVAPDDAELATAADDGIRDAAERRLPAHLDPRRVTVEADWWGAWWGYRLPRRLWPVQPPEWTFDLSRPRRDWRRRGRGSTPS